MSNVLIRFDKLLQLQQRCLDAVEYDQAKTVLRALQRSRVIQLLVLIFSNIATVYFITGHLQDGLLIITAGLLVFCNILGMAGTIWQLHILHQHEYWEDLDGAQKRMGLLQTAALLQSVMIRVSKVPFLAWPVYGMFVLSGGWAGFLSVLLLPLGIWLYGRVARKYLLELARFQ